MPLPTPAAAPQNRSLDALDRHTHTKTVLRIVAGADDVPATTERPQIWYVDTAAPQLWMTDADGKQQLGWSGQAVCTNDLSLGGTLQDVPGCSLTLPSPGTYIVIGSFNVEGDTGYVVAGGYLDVDGNAEATTARTGVEATLEENMTQVWRVTTTDSNVVVKLQAKRELGVAAVTVNQDHTTISAATFLGGEETASSHSHAHTDLTGVASDQHHGREHAMAGVADHYGTAWRLFYTNGDGDIVELAFGSNGQVLTSQGASAAPIFDDAPGGSIPTYIEDADQDTKIQTEESADEDVIRFDAGGVQVGYATAAGRWTFPVDGSSGGIVIGTDVFLYRSSANVLRIPDAVSIGGLLSLDANVKVDRINEYTLDAGVNVDSVVLKDGEVDGVDVAAHASNSDAHHSEAHTLDSHSSKAHSELTGVGEDDHHANVHTIVSHDTTATGANLNTLTNGSDADALHNHPGDLTPAEHTAIGDGAPHHAEAHTLDSHSTKAHSELTSVGADDHHSEDHASRHQHGGADEIASATPAADTIVKSGADGKLAAGWIQEVLAYADLTDDPYSDHSARHENGGADEISVEGLSGLLADGQTPLAHNTSHKHGGADEVASATPAANTIPKAGAGGTLAAGWVQEVLSHADLTDAPANAHHNQSHGSSDHSGKIGEVPLVITIPLTKPLPAATANATLDDDWLYKSPWTNEAMRISRWYIRFESALTGSATFQLYKNGTQISGAEITVSASARDASVDSFTEQTLAADDYLEVFQTAGSAEDVGGKAYIYGDQDVVTEVTYA